MTQATPDGAALREAYYARVTPLYGRAWQGKVLGVGGDPLAQEAALLLARCGLLEFALAPGAQDLPRRLAEQQPFEDRFSFLPPSRAQLFLAGPQETPPAGVSGPWLSVRFGPPNSAIGGALELGSCGQAPTPLWDEPGVRAVAPFDQAETVLRIASVARAVLLRGSSCEPADWRLLLGAGQRPVVLFHHRRWPWWLRSFTAFEARELLAASKRAEESARTPPGSGGGDRLEEGQAAAGDCREGTFPGRPGRILIVGCGSLGSVAAMRLASCGYSLTLCDPETVEAGNLCRQAYAWEDLGRPKALALAARLRARGWAGRGLVRGERDDPEGVRSFEALLEREVPDLVLLATGSGVEFALARTLRRRGIRHLSGRCYARARYFEIILVDGRRGPCLECLRDQVSLGPAPALTPEQAARYDPEYRPGELAAEPASGLDSGRCAEVMARLAAGLLEPEAGRPAWLRETLAQERTCFLGANHAEQEESGRWAYGLDLPGKVTTYGPEDVAGFDPALPCPGCGR